MRDCQQNDTHIHSQHPLMREYVGNSPYSKQHAKTRHVLSSAGQQKETGFMHLAQKGDCVSRVSAEKARAGLAGRRKCSLTRHHTHQGAMFRLHRVSHEGEGWLLAMARKPGGSKV